MASPTPLPSPSPSPTPFPRLTPGPAQVLTTFCDAINQRDLNTAWGQYAQALQKERATPPPFLVRITLVHCRVVVIKAKRGSASLLVIRTHQQIVSNIFLRLRSDSLGPLHGSAMIESLNLC
jgi:hypothetical protein